ncbi:MAG: hypothetical protein H7099_10550 [Gemmatimonadaceae bacterium]|nr:hypothetical protein [Gemmatimonadaceae bacterium]
MISGIVSRSSAAFLFGGGLALLFAPDVVLGALAPAMPADAYWLGQLLAAAWLGIASLNWLQRGVVIGGIYARPLVYTNFMLYFVSALSMVRVVFSPAVMWGVWLLAAPMLVLAMTYAALLFKGPFDPLDARSAGVR